MICEQPIVFALIRYLSKQRYLASIVSQHRAIDATLLHTTWDVKSCLDHSIELKCSNSPLITVTYADAAPVESKSPEFLIRWSGQNLTELHLSTPVFDTCELPLFLTTGRASAAHHYPVKVGLKSLFWGDTPDFLAEQSFWIRHYQKLIANGQSYYSSRLDDYRRELEIASRLAIGVGDALPITIQKSSHEVHSGSLLLNDMVSPGVFLGTLSVLAEHDLKICRIERRVKMEYLGKETEIASLIAEILD